MSRVERCETSTTDLGMEVSRTSLTSRSRSSTPTDERTLSLLRDVSRTATSLGAGASPATEHNEARAADACLTPTLSLVAPSSGVRSVVPRSRVKPREAREMCRLYVEDGLTIEEVARRVGRSTGSVQRHLHLGGVDVAPQSLNRRPRSNQVPHAEMARTVELYEAGLSTREVARELGMAPTGVRRRLDHAGRPRRSRSEVERRKGLTHPMRMDAEVERCVCVLYELGVLTDEISRWLGVSRGAITRAVRRNGLSFRRPVLSKEASEDKLEASKIDNALLRGVFLALDVPVSEIAFRCGWIKGADGSADTSRVQRALGLMPLSGETEVCRLVRSDVAAVLAEALGLDPWEVGA